MTHRTVQATKSSRDSTESSSEALRRPRGEGSSSEADPDTSCAGESASLRQWVPRRLDVSTTITRNWIQSVTLRNSHGPRFSHLQPSGTRRGRQLWAGCNFMVTRKLHGETPAPDEHCMKKRNDLFFFSLNLETMSYLSTHSKHFPIQRP